MHKFTDVKCLLSESHILNISLKMHICIEGIIGVGKSTLVEALSKSLEGYEFLFEDVENYQKFFSHNPLKLSYESDGNITATQLHIMDACFKRYSKDCSNSISDRCIFSCIPFIESYARTNQISTFTKDYLLYTRLAKNYFSIVGENLLCQMYI